MNQVQSFSRTLAPSSEVCLENTATCRIKPVVIALRNRLLLLSSTALLTFLSFGSATAQIGSDPDGTVTGYRFTTLPASAQGTLYVNGTAAVVNTTYTAAQVANQLAFDPSGTSTGNFTFHYVAVDNTNATSATALYTIPVNEVSANAAPIAYDVASGNLLLSSKDNNGQRKGIPAFSALDTDGSVSSYIVVSLPASGLLYVNGVAAAEGQSITPSQVTLLTYYAQTAGSYTFTFRATDNEGAVSNTATYHLYVNSTPATNAAPVVGNITAAAIPNGSVESRIRAFTGTDADGRILSYTIETLPGNWVGTLFVNGVAATAGQILTPAQAATLTFKPTITYESGTGVYFSFSATDNLGLKSAVARYTIPVAHNLDLTLGSTIMTGGPYKHGQEITVRFTVKNIGTGPAYDGVLVKDVLPDYLRFIRVGGDAWRYDASTDVYQVIGMAVGATYTFDITATLDAPYALLHTSTVYPANGVIDFDLSNNSTSYTLNNPPVASDVRTTVQSSTNASPISNLSATDADGSVIGYRFTSLPPSVEGGVYVGSSLAVVGTTYTADEVKDQLAFLFNGDNDTYTFTYVAIDNLTAESAPASYTVEVTNINLLPVTLATFSAVPRPEGNLLSWTTAAEIDNDYFEVQRSTDGRSFSAVGQVKGAGHSNLLLAYSFVDKSSPAGTVYYRLRQVDFKGAYEFSQVVAVASKTYTAARVKLYPNPVFDRAHLDMTLMPDGSYTVRLISMEGRTVQQLELSGGSVRQLDLRGLAPGRYVLQVQGAATVQTESLIKR